MSDDLDVALRAFAAADAFDRDAAELRAELRALRASGRIPPRWDTRPAVPDAVPRIALEAAFLIAAAVFVGVAGFGALTVVLAMAAAWLVVCGLEWRLARERSAPPPVLEESLLDALRPNPSARTHSSSAQR